MTTPSIEEKDILEWREQVLYKVIGSGHDMPIDDAEFIAKYIVIPLIREAHQAGRDEAVEYLRETFKDDCEIGVNHLFLELDNLDTNSRDSIHSTEEAN